MIDRGWFDYTYPSRRMALYGGRGAVGTSQHLAAQAGLATLRQGGNAIDAAITTAACLTVLEPPSTGLGADGSGLFIPGTGVALQNRGSAFSLDPRRATYLEPGKPPYHTIIPAFLTKDGAAIGPFWRDGRLDAAPSSHSGDDECARLRHGPATGA